MKKLLSLFLLFLQVVCHAQEAHYRMGNRSLKYSTGKADLLLELAAVGKSGFHARVGGVSFEQVAVPSPALVNSSISISYDSTAGDSNRLVVQIGNGTDSIYRMDIPDWELVPIARYTDNGYNAVVSLYGKDSTVQYNEAFRNNLLGMRMFQADIMFTNLEDTWDLIRDSVGNLIIADSEHKFKHRADDSLDYEFSMEIMRRRIFDGDSYILTDWGREVQFDVTGRSFYLTGEPYYLFTKEVQDPMSYIMQVRTVVDSLRDKPGIRDNNSFQRLAKLFAGNTLYSWYQDSIRYAISDMKYDDALIVDRPATYLEDVRRIIDNCKANDTLAYNDFERDPRFRSIESLTTQTATMTLAKKAESLIYKLYPAHAGFNHYCARVRDFIQANPNPSRQLAAEARFRTIQRLAIHAYDSTDAYKIRTAIAGLIDKYEFTNDTASRYLSRLDSIRTLVDDSTLISLGELKISVPYPGLNRLYDLAYDTTIRLSSRLLLAQSESIENLSPYLFNYNPAVYDAAVMVTRYAAFFRFIKAHSPQVWARFMKEISHAHVRASKHKENIASLEVLYTPNHRPY